MRIFVFIFFLFSPFLWSQNLQVAQSYYQSGKYDKAVLAFEGLLKANRANSQVVLGLAKSYRELENYTKANDCRFYF